MTSSVSEVILQRRRQMIVHSYLYYHLYEPIVSDDKWQEWANELRDLQNEHGAKFGFYDEDFADWDGTTGMHLSKEPWVFNKAMKLLRYKDSLTLE